MIFFFKFTCFFYRICGLNMPNQKNNEIIVINPKAPRSSEDIEQFIQMIDKIIHERDGLYSKSINFFHTLTVEQFYSHCKRIGSCFADHFFKFIEDVNRKSKNSNENSFVGFLLCTSLYSIENENIGYSFKITNAIDTADYVEEMTIIQVVKNTLEYEPNEKLVELCMSVMSKVLQYMIVRVRFDPLYSVYKILFISKTYNIVKRLDGKTMSALLDPKNLGKFSPFVFNVMKITFHSLFFYEFARGNNFKEDLLKNDGHAERYINVLVDIFRSDDPGTFALYDLIIDKIRRFLYLRNDTFHDAFRFIRKYSDMFCDVKYYNRLRSDGVRLLLFFYHNVLAFNSNVSYSDDELFNIAYKVIKIIFNVDTNSQHICQLEDSIVNNLLKKESGSFPLSVMLFQVGNVLLYKLKYAAENVSKLRVEMLDKIIEYKTICHYLKISIDYINMGIKRMYSNRVAKHKDYEYTVDCIYNILVVLYSVYEHITNLKTHIYMELYSNSDHASIYAEYVLSKHCLTLLTSFDEMLLNHLFNALTSLNLQQFPVTMLLTNVIDRYVNYIIDNNLDIPVPFIKYLSRHPELIYNLTLSLVRKMSNNIDTINSLNNSFRYITEKLVYLVELRIENRFYCDYHFETLLRHCKTIFWTMFRYSKYKGFTFLIIKTFQILHDLLRSVYNHNDTKSNFDEIERDFFFSTELFLCLARMDYDAQSSVAFKSYIDLYFSFVNNTAAYEKCKMEYIIVILTKTIVYEHASSLELLYNIKKKFKESLLSESIRENLYAVLINIFGKLNEDMRKIALKLIKFYHSHTRRLDRSGLNSNFSNYNVIFFENPYFSFAFNIETLKRIFSCPAFRGRTSLVDLYIDIICSFYNNNCSTSNYIRHLYDLINITYSNLLTNKSDRFVSHILSRAGGNYIIRALLLVTICQFSINTISKKDLYILLNFACKNDFRIFVQNLIQIIDENLVTTRTIGKSILSILVTKVDNDYYDPVIFTKFLSYFHEFSYLDEKPSFTGNIVFQILISDPSWILNILAKNKSVLKNSADCDIYDLITFMYTHPIYKSAAMIAESLHGIKLDKSCLDLIMGYFSVFEFETATYEELSYISMLLITFPDLFTIEKEYFESLLNIYDLTDPRSVILRYPYILYSNIQITEYTKDQLLQFSSIENEIFGVHLYGLINFYLETDVNLEHALSNLLNIDKYNGNMQQLNRILFQVSNFMPHRVYEFASKLLKEQVTSVKGGVNVNKSLYTLYQIFLCFQYSPIIKYISSKGLITKVLELLFSVYREIPLLNYKNTDLCLFKIIDVGGSISFDFIFPPNDNIGRVPDRKRNSDIGDENHLGITPCDIFIGLLRRNECSCKFIHQLYSKIYSLLNGNSDYRHLASLLLCKNLQSLDFKRYHSFCYETVKNHIFQKKSILQWPNYIENLILFLCKDNLHMFLDLVSLLCRELDYFYIDLFLKIFNHVLRKFPTDTFMSFCPNSEGAGIYYSRFTMAYLMHYPDKATACLQTIISNNVSIIYISDLIISLVDRNIEFDRSIIDFNQLYSGFQNKPHDIRLKTIQLFSRIPDENCVVQYMESIFQTYFSEILPHEVEYFFKHIKLKSPSIFDSLRKIILNNIIRVMHSFKLLSIIWGMLYKNSHIFLSKKSIISTILFDCSIQLLRTKFVKFNIRENFMDSLALFDVITKIICSNEVVLPSELRCSIAVNLSHFLSDLARYDFVIFAKRPKSLTSLVHLYKKFGHSFNKDFNSFEFLANFVLSSMKAENIDKRLLDALLNLIDIADSLATDSTFKVSEENVFVPFLNAIMNTNKYNTTFVIDIAIFLSYIIPFTNQSTIIADKLEKTDGDMSFILFLILSRDLDRVSISAKTVQKVIAARKNQYQYLETNLFFSCITKIHNNFFYNILFYELNEIRTMRVNRRHTTYYFIIINNVLSNKFESLFPLICELFQHKFICHNLIKMHSWDSLKILLSTRKLRSAFLSSLVRNNVEKISESFISDLCESFDNSASANALAKFLDIPVCESTLISCYLDTESLQQFSSVDTNSMIKYSTATAKTHVFIFENDFPVVKSTDHQDNIIIPDDYFISGQIPSIENIDEVTAKNLLRYYQGKTNESLYLKLYRTNVYSINDMSALFTYTKNFLDQNVIYSTSEIPQYLIISSIKNIIKDQSKIIDESFSYRLPISFSSSLHNEYKDIRSYIFKFIPDDKEAKQLKESDKYLIYKLNRSIFVHMGLSHTNVELGPNNYGKMLQYICTLPIESEDHAESVINVISNILKRKNYSGSAFCALYLILNSTFRSLAAEYLANQSDFCHISPEWSHVFAEKANDYSLHSIYGKIHPAYKYMLRGSGTEPNNNSEQKRYNSLIQQIRNSDTYNIIVERMKLEDMMDYKLDDPYNDTDIDCSICYYMYSANYSFEIPLFTIPTSVYSVNCYLHSPLSTYAVLDVSLFNGKRERYLLTPRPVMDASTSTFVSEFNRILFRSPMSHKYSLRLASFNSVRVADNMYMTRTKMHPFVFETHLAKPLHNIGFHSYNNQDYIEWHKSFNCRYACLQTLLYVKKCQPYNILCSIFDVDNATISSNSFLSDHKNKSSLDPPKFIYGLISPHLRDTCSKYSVIATCNSIVQSQARIRSLCLSLYNEDKKSSNILVRKASSLSLHKSKLEDIEQRIQDKIFNHLYKNDNQREWF